mmetsp:Transcript_28158/g.90000  ORF Transcript_28158/g.90000 Transcript_28158/m.90000 type:complete len:257 (-) Transcript_28158:120-890(-)
MVPLLVRRDLYGDHRCDLPAALHRAVGARHAHRRRLLRLGGERDRPAGDRQAHPAPAHRGVGGDLLPAGLRDLHRDPRVRGQHRRYRRRVVVVGLPDRHRGGALHHHGLLEALLPPQLEEAGAHARVPPRALPGHRRLAHGQLRRGAGDLRDGAAEAHRRPARLRPLRQGAVQDEGEPHAHPRDLLDAAGLRGRGRPLQPHGHAVDHRALQLRLRHGHRVLLLARPLLDGPVAVLRHHPPGAAAAPRVPVLRRSGP